ncbi:S-layer homology domain-containing protein [Paenibacillus sp. SN-8-1]|uniref:S-layer homology domain-containing protein n=1 Tax=Paenibacillus sp. SN-8-1 TaxID=3435409 RepID=UPI003D9A64FA
MQDFKTVKVAAVNPNVKFTDIANHWARADIERAVKNGYVGGYSDGTFKPNASITRAEFITLFVRATKLQPQTTPKATFTDVPGSFWASDAINTAVAMGVLNPNSIGTKFNPNVALSRGDVAKWFGTALMQSNVEFKKAYADTLDTLLPFTEDQRGLIPEVMVPYLALVRGTQLMGGNPGGKFGIGNATTRAEMVTMLYR